MCIHEGSPVGCTIGKPPGQKTQGLKKGAGLAARLLKGHPGYCTASFLSFESGAGVVAGRARPLAHWRRPLICSAMSFGGDGGNICFMR